MEKSLQILLAVHHFPPRYAGGAEWQTYRMARTLQNAGHRVRVVCVEHIDRGPSGGLEWQDDEYEGIPVRRLSFNLSSAPDPFLWSYNNAWIGEHFTRLLEETQPDLFHLVGGYLITASALESACQQAIPTVLTLTDFWFLCPRIHMLRSDGQVSTLPIRAERCARCLGEEKRRYRYPGKLFPGLMDSYWRQQKGPVQQIESRQAYLLRVLNQVGAIISPSQFLRSLYAQSGVDPARIRFSRQGRDFPELQPEMLAKPKSDTLRIGYTGHLAELKGVHVLLEAVRRLPGARLSLKVYGDATGHPAYADRLRKLASGDKRIELAGPYPSQEIGRVLQDLDVVVVPSVCYENSPTVILEAFAHRTPVLASRLGGMAEMVAEGQDGLLFQPGDPDDLACKIQTLLDQPGLLDRLRSGIRPIKTVAQEMDELLQVYHQLAPAMTA